MESDVSEKYHKTWEYIKQWGFNKGSVIPYFVVCTCCEKAGLKRDELDLNEFQKIYECHVG